MNFMRYESVVCGLEKLSARGMNFGVERTRAILDGLNSPDKFLKIIHIAGTNGKGSVAEYVTQILLAAGKTVGTFTSPAVYEYLEQFRINGENIQKELFSKAFGAALKFADGATRFEVETAGALNAFCLAGCEYAVVECGLGGTYDATNAISKKQVALICSLSLEHTGILGGTLESICAHKAGIIKDCAAFVSGFNAPQTLEFFRRQGATVAKEYNELPNLSKAQSYNAGLAAECARFLKIDETAIYSGVKRAKPVGRTEIIRRGATYILDGAHNPEAFSPLVETLKKIERDNLTVIFGCLADKDICGNLKALSAAADCVIAVECPSPRALPVDKTLEACARYFKYYGKAESVAAALDCTHTAFVAVCGSFTLLKEAKEWIEKS